MAMNGVDRIHGFNARLKDKIRVIEEFAKERPDGVQVYDFGNSVVTMPVPDRTSGSYLTSTICALFIEGQKQMRQPIPFRRGNEVVELPGGWKFITVEFSHDDTPEQLRERLTGAKDKLLEAAHGCKA